MMICPRCRVERADYEGPNGAFLPTCPNCGAKADPAMQGFTPWHVLLDGRRIGRRQFGALVEKVGPFASTEAAAEEARRRNECLEVAL